VSPGSFSILEKIAPVVQLITNPVRLEGHTDSVPIHTSRFRSNWELSTARSIAMLELLREKYQYPTERMSVTGFAENAPADSNETAEGRAHNRRVDLVVVSAEALSAESATAKK
jgi:chemotaxis protein MotB